MSADITPKAVDSEQARPKLVQDITPEEIDAMRELRGKGMVSAVGEYTPDELWTALEEIERLRGLLAASGAPAAAPAGKALEEGQGVTKGGWHLRPAGSEGERS